jgi:hypothetical protein
MNGVSSTVQEIVERARTDPQFLHNLVFNPTETAKGLRLTEEERQAIASSTPERLIGAVVSTLRGCGSTGTCVETCKQTCTVTFTSVQAA